MWREELRHDKTHTTPFSLSLRTEKYLLPSITVGILVWKAIKPNSKLWHTSSKTKILCKKANKLNRRNLSNPKMMTMNVGPPDPPPMPYYDDDEMLDDYIDDDDFGEPPPPPPAEQTSTKPSATQNTGDEYNDDYLEDMMEFEGQRQQQQHQESSTATETENQARINTDALDPTDDTPDTALQEQENESGNENENNLNTNNNTNTVEEYLAARRQDTNLYNFER